MKAIASCFIILLFACNANGKERAYTASTPAGPLVKLFLGIPLSDSVDYIRWNIILRDKDYLLNCNYKIEGNNKPGFQNGAKRVELKGILLNRGNYYTLHNKDKTLKLAALNANLLHILNTDNSLLIGNGGWSYTINSLKPSSTKGISIKASPTVVKDSMVFIGRSPCSVPGVISQGVLCYKLKWKIVFYGNSRKNEPATCKVYGTPYRKEGGKQGIWKIVAGGQGRIFYHIYDEKGRPYLYFEKADENILLFTDAKGKLLTGDEEYSFTLNRSS